MANVEAAFRNLHQNLLDACKVGDQKAQFQIYKLYYKAMYNTSLRIVNDSMEAEDIMQEAFLSAFEKIDTYSGTVSFGAWLKKIVINRSLDALGKKKAVFEDIESHVGLRDESEDETERYQEAGIRMEEVKEAIERLPDGYRVILSLYLLEGYDHDEIAEILKISSSTSRSQLSRAKQKLIGELKKDRM
ncbi:MAG TPA: sigma-70 family RNA polymerase sigma factor [Bacteroidales bacterium]|nr:sigma-70 family RNA polymerase sigma factor [Bacteroidales bacterium]HPF04186.1 sigma-70 family RNA polymerase sigma factor [Bacteroidales bacterium]HPJ59462.1 sigma-70 family RNA polymerase sigma factor [Bacteroidales bacterium]HPR12845.1 sigma-70 family RNA polymerase sigma factor [Bacteroidales bacterium]HRW85128.1 sigma-70 family RNA polymerase sigma factor [Bacteroidales bacterium]